MSGHYLSIMFTDVNLSFGQTQEMVKFKSNKRCDVDESRWWSQKPHGESSGKQKPNRSGFSSSLSATSSPTQPTYSPVAQLNQIPRGHIELLSKRLWKELLLLVTWPATESDSDPNSLYRHAATRYE